MATVKLGARPESFKPFPVKFVMPDGTDGAITATFKYRTRLEFATLQNEGGPNPDLPKRADGSLDFEVMHRETVKRNARHLLEALQAWDLEEQLTLENLETMCSGLPAAAQALADAYRSACVDGRLGN